MARYLFAPMPLTGHVNPGLPIAKALIARGHDVRFYSSARFKKAIEGIGARWVPLRNALAVDEEHLDMFPGRPAEGIAQLQYDIKNIFIEFVRGALADLVAELRREPADVIVGDNASAVVEAVHQKVGIPWAVYGITVLGMSSRDTAPFGLALPPSSTPLGRMRNKTLSWLVRNVIFREAKEHNAKMRRELGLPALGRFLFDFGKGADLYLQGSVPSFDYPRTDLPANVHYIGVSMPPPPADWQPPSWWQQLRTQRVVLVTQGTINNDFDQLIRPAIRALAEENVLVVVTTGSRPAEDVELDPLPSNVRVERFIPYAHLMPHVDLLLTNGGYGSIQIALAHGVPVVAIGKTEDKAEIANRVEWSGVGIGLKVRVPSETQIRNAVTRVFTTPTYAARAEALRYELSGLDAARSGADLLEELAGEQTLLEQSA
ncbi:MAG TPA: nucleotide disphospho-sugar-binding domain-containing protein [Thermoanaerobaculia bacterium]|nr:nucleotide disphospho-sugar-binding domain-containing protein [Thermoanaerobaculia bacterium]